MSMFASATTDTSSGPGLLGLTSRSGPEPSRFDKMIEVVAVLLLGLTTVGTAWCGFQSVRWSGASAEYSQSASDQHVEAARLFGLATQTLAYDASVTGQYAEAMSAGDTELATFILESLVRADFRPTLESWRDEVAAGGSPAPLVENQEYVDTQLAPFQAAIADAEEDARKGREAGSNAATYISVTILLAAALFFTGVISSFRFWAARALLLAAALATLGVAASRLASLPVLF
jgi:hypothetical protein